MSIIEAFPGPVSAVPELPRIMIDDVVRAALLEDLGRAGDITTDAIVPRDAQAVTRLVARQHGVLAGLALARSAFAQLDDAAAFKNRIADGARLEPGTVIAEIHGSAWAMLAAERCALNFLCHLSGVATATSGIVDAIRGYGARVTCTRKTVPGLRALQKYAVRVGGGRNHRFGLDDAVLVKDNHIAMAGGIREAVTRVRAAIGHMVKVELEVDTLAQLEEALEIGVDAVLLDNMSLDDLRTAVRMCRGRAVTEASGRVTPQTAPEVAATGVDLIAIGWITHSSATLDIGLDT